MHAGCLGLWLFFLSSFLNSHLENLSIPELVNITIPDLVKNVLTNNRVLFFIFLIFGFLVAYMNKSRRWITLRIREKLIKRCLNNYDIEAFVIVKILDK